MKEIKFRAWDINKKVFIPVDAYAVITNDFNALGIMMRDWENYNEGEYFYKDSQAIDQFTGLTDKNGIEIYEGDIIESETGKPMPVKWNERFASFCLYREDWAFAHWFGEGADPKQCVVIGNIHQHPELLKPS